ncbi:hypothetical protein F4677DRAFT_449656 [Hypoxylon crocopeplum]|nr:hypothetical protein F4677DRAFT_449656 [Hypoxylon crocopeplum]
MQSSRPPIESPLRVSSYAPRDPDNAKCLSSVMIGYQNRPSAAVPAPSSRSPFAEDREPLLGHASTRRPTNSLGNTVIESPPKRSYWVGLPLIVFCRLFNTIFAACTIDKANKDVGEGWNIRIHKLLFDFCWIILVWNVFALAASIFNCVFFPPSGRGAEGSKRDFRDKLRAQFAINDAVLALITLVLLVVACHAVSPHWDGTWVGLRPPVVAMVSSLVTVEFLIAMVQPFRFSERMLFAI